MITVSTSERSSVGNWLSTGPSAKKIVVMSGKTASQVTTAIL